MAVGNPLMSVNEFFAADESGVEYGGPGASVRTDSRAQAAQVGILIVGAYGIMFVMTRIGGFRAVVAVGRD